MFNKYTSEDNWIVKMLAGAALGAAAFFFHTEGAVAENLGLVTLPSVQVVEAAPQAPQVLGVSVVNVSNASELSAALASATGGETVVLANGNYGRNTINGKNYSSRVTIKAANKDGAVFSRFDVNNSSNVTVEGIFVNPFGMTVNSGPLFQLLNSQNVSFLNVRVESDTNAGTGFSIDSSKNVLIENSTIASISNGVKIRKNSQGVTIRKNDISGFTADAVNISPAGGSMSNILIEENLMHSPNTGSGAHPDMVQLFDTKAGSLNGITIKSNIVLVPQKHTQTFFFGSNNGTVANAEISNNFIYNNQVRAISVQATANVKIHNNTLLATEFGNPTTDGIPRIYANSSADIQNNVVVYKQADFTNNNTVDQTKNTLFRTETGDANYFRKAYPNLPGAGFNPYSITISDMTPNSMVPSTYGYQGAGWSGSPTPTPTPTPTPEVVTTDYLNVRDEAGGTVLDVVPEGTKGTVTDSVPVEANGHTYVEVDFDNDTDGWVAEQYLERSDVEIKKTVETTNLQETESPKKRSQAEINALIKRLYAEIARLRALYDDEEELEEEAEAEEEEREEAEAEEEEHEDEEGSEAEEESEELEEGSEEAHEASEAENEESEEGENSEASPQKLVLGASSIIAHSNNFANETEADNLFDGCVTDVTECVTEAGAPSYWVEIDLGDTYQLAKARIYGDSAGSWHSRTWKMQTRGYQQSTYSTVFSGKNAFGTKWFEEEFEISARYVKVYVYGTEGSNKTQAMELELYGN